MREIYIQHSPSLQIRRVEVALGGPKGIGVQIGGALITLPRKGYSRCGWRIVPESAAPTHTAAGTGRPARACPRVAGPRSSAG